MIRAYLAGDRIAVECPPTWNEIVKRIPGSRYHAGTWTVPLSWPTCLQIRDEFGQNITIDQSLVEWANAYLKRRESVEAAQRGEFVAPGLDERLRPQQALGATWLAWAGRCMLLDEMRAGKTPQIIQSLKVVGESAFPALVICPSTTRWVWATEVEFWGGAPMCPHVLSGTAAQRKKQLAEAQECATSGGATVVITNWENIRTMSRLEGYGSVEMSDKEKQEGPLNTFGFKTVVADEAHRAIGPHNKQTRALWYLMHHAERRILATATPIANNGGDLWSLWFAIAPEECQVRTKWIERYCIAGPGRHGGWEVAGFRPDKMDEMFAGLDPRMLRRTMREVRPGMPDRLPPEIRMQLLEGKQEKTYASLKKDMLAVLETVDGETGVLVVPDPLVLSGRLSYAAAATPVLDDAGNVVALSTPSVKVDALLDVLDENPGESLVVFCVSKKLAILCEEQLAKKKVSYVSVHGDIDPMLRAANVQNFQAGTAQVIVCTTATGAEGITLNRAHRTLFLQRDWSDNVRNLQAEARTDGLEGGPPIETIIHVTAGTIEERTLPGVKRQTLQELLRDELRVG